MKLNTLKTIDCKRMIIDEYEDKEGNYKHELFISMDLIKQEAIKWIKAENIDDGFKEWNGVYSWIKHFFDIKEADLK